MQIQKSRTKKYSKEADFARDRSKGVKVPLGGKRITRYTSGICTICGIWCDCVLPAHAKEHGFETPEDMVKAGVLRMVHTRRVDEDGTSE